MRSEPILRTRSTQIPMYVYNVMPTIMFHYKLCLEETSQFTGKFDGVTVFM